MGQAERIAYFMTLIELPPYLEPLFSKDQIQAAVANLGRQITPWAANVSRETAKDVIAIPVLRGGFFFAADLMREVHASLELWPVRSVSYQESANNVQNDKINLSIENLAVKGRSVLILDDMCDSGRTLRVLYKELVEQGAEEIRSAVLIKRTSITDSFNPDWVGLEYFGEEWLVGMGLEDENRFRNLPAVYRIRNSG